MVNWDHGVIWIIHTFQYKIQSLPQFSKIDHAHLTHTYLSRYISITLVHRGYKIKATALLVPV